MGQGIQDWTKKNLWKTACKKFWSDIVWLGRWYHLKFFKSYLPQILLDPFLNTWTQIFFWPCMITSFWWEILMLIGTILGRMIFANHTILNISSKPLLVIRSLLIIRPYISCLWTRNAVSKSHLPLKKGYLSFTKWQWLFQRHTLKAGP